MKKKDLFDVLTKPGMIPGIYNYCDQWCERCPFTQNCANYIIIEKHFSGEKERDINNKLFWEKLHKLFNLTLEILKESAEKEGIDPESLILSSDDTISDDISNFESVIQSEMYIHLVEDWFDSNKVLFENFIMEFEETRKLDLPSSHSADQLNNIRDMIEVIKWYQSQINMKLNRAASSKQEDDMDDYSPKDSDGSAKVALIGIDRSISAWGTFLSTFPEREDEILNILVHLERLRRKTESEFPMARKFIRPGFDNIS